VTALFGPTEGLFLAELPLDGCQYCGVITKYQHFQRWAPQPVGWHEWMPLTQQQIKERMLARRAARLNDEPPKYHATTGWAADHTGESADPYCADCGTESCRQWIRIQTRLDNRRMLQELGVRLRYPSVAEGLRGGQ
jgi:hypothetical protein